MSERVLILDDEPDFAAYAEETLAGAGHVVRVITRSLQTPAAIGEFEPTVLLLDIVMPDLDGIEIVDWLAKTGFGGRVILISGFNPSYMRATSNIAENKGLRLGRMLQKPVSPETLRDAVAGSS